MSREDRLQQLLENPQVWRSKASQGVHRTLTTGFAALDEHLNGGWPIGVLTELLVDTEGAGELSLLMPALAHISQSIEPGAAHWLAWVAPPHIPYPPALCQHGIDVSRVLIVQPDSVRETLWTLEQILRAEVCGAVLGWLTSADDRSLRRLQLAAEAGRCWAVIFRPARFADSASPSPLRIVLSADHAGLHLNLLRNRYGRLGTVSLSC